ncbi:MAG: cytochrome b [Kangiellaceae bacterium]|nr:cytochrome b [Kangiellaceae bacterium]
MKNTNQKYGWLTIALHWISAMTIVGLFSLGLWMVELGYYDAWYKTGPALHKSIGLTFFLLMIFRLFWRTMQIQPHALSTHTPLERKAGHVMHRVLYLIIFFIMLSGYLISTADGRDILVFKTFNVPGIGSLFENQEDIAGLFHEYAAFLLIAMVILHALAALKHHFIDKDKTLTRMLGRKR